MSRARIHKTSCNGYEISHYEPKGGPSSSVLFVARHAADENSEAGERLLGEINYDSAAFSKKDALEYAQLEKDTGTKELAEATALLLAEKHKIRVYLATALIPRSFLDFNREDFNLAIRILGRHLPAELLNELISDHQEFIHITNILNRTAKIYCTWHSMWENYPYDEAIDGEGNKESTKSITAAGNHLSLAAQVDIFRKGVRLRPDLCMIDELWVGPDKARRVVGDRQMSLRLAEKMAEKMGWEFKMNDPYPMGWIKRGGVKRDEVAADTHLVQSRKEGGLIVELNKRCLSDRTGLNTEVNLDKIHPISQEFAEALSEELHSK